MPPGLTARMQVFFYGGLHELRTTGLTTGQYPQRAHSEPCPKH